jgi:hypothetical protein
MLHGFVLHHPGMAMQLEEAAAPRWIRMTRNLAIARSQQKAVLVVFPTFWFVAHFWNIMPSPGVLGSSTTFQAELSFPTGTCPSHEQASLAVAHSKFQLFRRLVSSGYTSFQGELKPASLPPILVRNHDNEL